eukprot:Skav223272  [mRNA]  locus=scaffold3424:134413:136398:+ [translate_table: standard]
MHKTTRHSSSWLNRATARPCSGFAAAALAAASVQVRRLAERSMGRFSQLLEAHEGELWLLRKQNQDLLAENQRLRQQLQSAVYLSSDWCG